MNKKTIFVSISVGIIGRNILSIPNGFLSNAKKNFDLVVLLVPTSTVDFYQSEYGADNILVEGVDESISKHESNSWLRGVFSFFYTYLLFTENAKGLAWEGVYLSVRPKATWSGRLSYPLKWFIGNSFGRSGFVRTWFVPFVDNLLHRQSCFDEYFVKYKPSLVFTPNVERWQDICLIREARRRSVVSVGMPGSWDHFPKRFRPIHPDLLLVNTYTQKNEAIKYQSYKTERVSVVGVPYYDAFAQVDKFLLSREDFCSQYGFDPNKKIIFFSSESIYSPDDGDIADMLHKSIKSGKINRPAQLMVRPYPGVDTEHKKFDHLNDSSDVYVDWVNRNVTTRGQADAWYPNFAQIIHFMNCIVHSDVIVNSYSSIAIEAAYFNKQSVWVNFDGYKQRSADTSIKRFSSKIHLKNIRETGGVYVVESQSELIEKINSVLNGEININLEVLRHKMCGPLDGNTSKRIVRHLINAIK